MTEQKPLSEVEKRIIGEREKIIKLLRKRGFKATVEKPDWNMREPYKKIVVDGLLVPISIEQTGGFFASSSAPLRCSIHGPATKTLREGKNGFNFDKIVDAIEAWVRYEKERKKQDAEQQAQREVRDTFVKRFNHKFGIKPAHGDIFVRHGQKDKTLRLRFDLDLSEETASKLVSLVIREIDSRAISNQVVGRK